MTCLILFVRFPNVGKSSFMNKVCALMNINQPFLPVKLINVRLYAVPMFGLWLIILIDSMLILKLNQLTAEFYPGCQTSLHSLAKPGPTPPGSGQDPTARITRRTSGGRRWVFVLPAQMQMSISHFNGFSPESGQTWSLVKSSHVFYTPTWLAHIYRHQQSICINLP